MKTAEAKRKLQHELYLKMNKDEADRLIDEIESYVSQVRSEERDKQCKNCIYTFQDKRKSGHHDVEDFYKD